MPAAELDLNSLDDGELVEQIFDDLYDGLAPEVAEGTRILLERGWPAGRVLNEALVGGMNVVGANFRDGALFVPEVLRSANAMKSGLGILKPVLSETGTAPIGRMVLGTVKGDIHDIGKNLAGMMMEGGGYEVVDLGINVDAEAFVDAVEKHRPDVLGISALLTTTMPYMKTVIDALREQGLRERCVVLVGGAPVTEAFARAVGADAYCRDAGSAVALARELTGRRRAGGAAVP